MSSLLVLMSFVLGLGSFLVGILPLSFVLSKAHINLLSTLGTGLLIGTALGVIIPEGVEAVASNHASSEEHQSPAEIPTSTISISLLCGFFLMLVVEQLLATDSHSHSHPYLGSVSLQESNAIEFEAELGELENEQGMSRPPVPLRSGSNTSSDGVQNGRRQALTLTLGLFVHAIADGLALGASFLPMNTSHPSDLSLIVFLALLIHKAPTALALTTSLLATNLPRTECRKHLALFSASTPIGALLSYYLISYLGSGLGQDWTGVALLFSGGTFLYVATVLQPVSGDTDDMSKIARVAIIAVGMFIPFTLGVLLGHGHEH